MCSTYDTIDISDNNNNITFDIIATLPVLDVLSQRFLLWRNQLNELTDGILEATDYSPGKLSSEDLNAFYDLLELWQQVKDTAESLLYLRNTTFITGDTGGT